MEFFKQWAISVCASGIIATVFSMIAPKGSMDKILKLMISVFIFTSLLTPFLTGEKPDLSFLADITAQDGTSEDSLRSMSDELTMRTAKGSVEETITAFLQQHGCSDCRVQAELQVDENHYVQIVLIRLYLSEADLSRGDELKRMTETEYQIKTEVFSLGELP